MAVVLETIEGLKNKIKDNILNDSNPYGLLRQKEWEYLKCLEFGHRELE